MPDIRASLFGSLVLRMGLATEEQIAQCLATQAKYEKRGKPPPRLGEVLAAKGFLTVDQVRSLLKKQALAQKANAASVPVDEPPSESTNIATAMATSAVNDAIAPATPATSAPAGEQPGVEFGKFKILKRLGEDASGYTYKAKYLPKDTTVILRTLSHETMSDEPEYVKRFEAQISKATGLQHKHVQRIVAGGRLHGRDYYAAEYIEGISLRRVLESRGKLDLDFGLTIGMQVCQALAAGHAQGLFHQEVRPSNILITSEKNIKLSGFGVAHDVIGNLRKLAASAGDTPFYVAPEQALPGKSDQGDARTDLYCLGATLYHALTGQPPFQGTSIEEVLINLTEEDIPDPTLLNPDISRTLSDLLLSLLNPEPADRYQSAEQLLKALTACHAAATKRGTGTKNRIRGAAMASTVMMMGNKPLSKKVSIGSGIISAGGKAGSSTQNKRTGMRREKGGGRRREKKNSAGMVMGIGGGFIVVILIVIYLVSQNREDPSAHNQTPRSAAPATTSGAGTTTGTATTNKGTDQAAAPKTTETPKKSNAPTKKTPPKSTTPEESNRPRRGGGLLGSINSEGGDEGGGEE